MNIYIMIITVNDITFNLPEIINLTPQVISRMQTAKKFLQKNFKCKNSFSNYVLFKKKNKYTRKFGCKNIDGHFRMALADLKILNGK